MATKLFLRNTQANRVYPDDTVRRMLDLLTTAGPSLQTAVVNTAASGTDIWWTKTAGGFSLEWVSPPVSADFTIATTDTLTFNLWALENSMNANAGARVHLYVWNRGNGGGENEMPGSPFTSAAELNTVAAVNNWTGNLSSSQLVRENDRIVVRAYIAAVGGTMAGGFTCTLDYDGPTGAADGDSWVQLNNTITFKAENYGQDVLQRFTIPPLTSPILPGFPYAPDIAWLAADACRVNNSLAPERRRGRHGRLQLVDCTSNFTPDGLLKIGNGFHFRARNHRIEIPKDNVNTYWPSSMTAITIAMALRRNSGPANNAEWASVAGSSTCVIGGYGAATTSYPGWKFGNTPKSVAITTEEADQAMGDSLWVFTAGARGMEIWRDGILKASNANTDTYTPTSGPFIIGCNGGQGVDDLTVGLLYIFFRQLPRAAIRSLSHNPI